MFLIIFLIAAYSCVNHEFFWELNFVIIIKFKTDILVQQVKLLENIWSLFSLTAELLVTSREIAVIQTHLILVAKLGKFLSVNDDTLDLFLGLDNSITRFVETFDYMVIIKNDYMVIIKNDYMVIIKNDCMVII